MTKESIEGEVVDAEMDDAPTTALVTKPIGEGTAIVATTPAEFVGRAAEIASALASVIDNQHLYADIQGKQYVSVEGWTTLAAMLGVTPMELSNERQEDDSYVAVMALINAQGREIVRASSECGSHKDHPWPSRANYAKRSMAATRATSKACRLAFSWIMTLAGYAVTPAEEVPEGGFPADDAVSPPKAGRPPRARGTSPPRGTGGRRAKFQTCPECGEAAVIRGKEEYGGGFVCWKKQGGCGRKFQDEEELAGRAEEAPPIDIDDVVTGAETTTEDQAPPKMPDPIEPPEGLFDN